MHSILKRCGGFWLVGLVVCMASWLPTRLAGGAEPKLEKTVEELSERVSKLEEGKGEEAKEKEKEKESKDMATHWKDGVKFQYKGDGIEAEFGGRLDVDFTFWTGDQDMKNVFGEPHGFGVDNHLKDGVEIRRARLHVAGLLYDHVIFKVEYDFASGEAEARDLYVGLTKVPVMGTLRVGHQKEPFSLEQLTSARFITFIERSLPDVFAPAFNTGVLTYNDLFSKRVTYALGVFREADDFGFGDGDAGYNVTARVTGLPVYADNGRVLVHLGGAYSYRNPTDDFVRYRQRPEAHLTPRFVDTRDPNTGSDLQSDGVQLVNGEAAAVFGPFSIQGEYTAAFIQVLPTTFADFPANTMPNTPFPYSSGGDAFFQGGYVFASYFLTGEHRPYKTSNGVFDRVRPKRVFMDGKGGYGAWEIAGRFSRLDMEDGPYNPSLGVMPGGLTAATFGKINNYTTALNWYLNPNTRVMFNYVISDPDPNGLAHLFITRFHVDF